MRGRRLFDNAPGVATPAIIAIDCLGCPLDGMIGIAHRVARGRSLWAIRASVPHGSVRMATLTLPCAGPGPTAKPVVMVDVRLLSREMPPLNGAPPPVDVFPVLSGLRKKIEDVGLGFPMDWSDCRVPGPSATKDAASRLAEDLGEWNYDRHADNEYDGWLDAAPGARGYDWIGKRIMELRLYDDAPGGEGREWILTGGLPNPVVMARGPA